MRDVGASRWSPAHQRVFQGVRPCRRREFEAADQPRHGRRGDLGRTKSRNQPGRGDRGDPAQCADGSQRRRHGRVRAMQQPAGRQCGGQVGGGHGRRGVMPGMPVAASLMGDVPLGSVSGVSAVGVVRAAGRGQRQVQGGLRDDRARHDRGQGQATAGDRPDQGELPQREDDHQPPRHSALGDRMVPQRSKGAADEREQPGPHARRRTARPRTRAPAAVRRHAITRHGRHLVVYVEAVRGVHDGRQERGRGCAGQSASRASMRFLNAS